MNIIRNKAARPDGIVKRMLAALDDFIDKIKEIMNLIINIIYNNGDVPENLGRSGFIALPRKLSPNECELYHVKEPNEPHNEIYNPNSNSTRSKIRPKVEQE